MELSDYIDRLKNHMDFGSAFIYHRRIPPLEATYGSEHNLARNWLIYSKSWESIGFTATSQRPWSLSVRAKMSSFPRLPQAERA